MKLLYKIGLLLAGAFAVLGLVKASEFTRFGTGLTVCTMALICATALSLGVFTFHLRDRIVALEKRAREPR